MRDGICYGYVIVVVSIVMHNAIFSSAFSLPTEKQTKMSHKSSAELYKKIVHEILPRFERYMTYTLKIHSKTGIDSKAFFMGRARMCPKTYTIETGGNIAASSIIFEKPKNILPGSRDSFWWIHDCILTIPSLGGSDNYYGPYNKNEAYFLISRELAHLALGTCIQYQVELNTTHYPELLRDKYYQKYRTRYKDLLGLYLKLWPECAHKHQVNAIIAGIDCGGDYALKGAITYTARCVIYKYHRKEELQRHSFLTLSLKQIQELHNIESILQEQCDSMRNIIRYFIHQSLTPKMVATEATKICDDVKIVYTNLIKAMPEWHHISEHNQIKLLSLGSAKFVSD